MQSESTEKPSKDVCYVESICTRCDFYKGTEDDLECAAFKILKKLIENNTVSLADIKNADIK